VSGAASVQPMYSTAFGGQKSVASTPSVQSWTNCDLISMLLCKHVSAIVGPPFFHNAKVFDLKRIWHLIASYESIACLPRNK
jgi:hypothetical protein